MFAIQNKEGVTMETKIVNIRKFPVDTWRKARKEAIEEGKTIGQWLAEVIEKHSPAFQATIAKVIMSTHCGHCQFDEAEGEVFRHCDRCCREIVTAISAIVFGGKDG